MRHLQTYEERMSPKRKHDGTVSPYRYYTYGDNELKEYRNYVRNLFSDILSELKYIDYGVSTLRNHTSYVSIYFGEYDENGNFIQMLSEEEMEHNYNILKNIPFQIENKSGELEVQIDYLECDVQEWIFENKPDCISYLISSILNVDEICDNIKTKYPDIIESNELGLL